MNAAMAAEERKSPCWRVKGMEKNLEMRKDMNNGLKGTWEKMINFKLFQSVSLYIYTICISEGKKLNNGRENILIV